MRIRMPLGLDAALAVAGAAALIVEGLLRADGGLAPGAYVLALGAATPLAWRQRAPLAALAGVEIGALMCAVAFDATWTATGLVLVELYTVALLGNRQRSVVVGAITAIAVVVAIVLIEGNVELTGASLRIALVFAALALGDTVRSRQALRSAARERAEREQRDREQEASRRAAAERLLIAQELHDTLAHSLVAINVRSSVALDLQGSQDPAAALADIKHASATALNDLRSTLGLLREQGDSAPTAPGFDLEGLPGLVEHACTAGLHADLEVQVNGAAVPSAIGAVAYRIVQEALTNVLRHGDATSAHVHVRVSGDALHIEVTDDGRADSVGANPGLGLRGMTERSAALGGRMSVGPREQGGWRVHAVLPLRGGQQR
jgi:signal transduction histidine kinase